MIKIDDTMYDCPHSDYQDYTDIFDVSAAPKLDKSNETTEFMSVQFFSTNGHFLRETFVTTLSRNSVEIPVRNLVKLALLIDARSLILSHNHPSGDSNPSDADIVQTRQLVRLLEPLGIHLRDHVITATYNQFSFREAGLI